MIEVNELRKTFGDVEAVRGVSFSVEPGEVFGFLGPNGAGKTTTINMLCTLAKPTSGSATVAGHDVATERDDVRRHIGLVFQDPTLDGYLTAEQNLKLHAELYGVESRAGRRPHAAGARDGRPLRPQGLGGRHLQRRHAAAAGDRPRPDALAARAVPRRADDRPGPADPQLDLELHPRAQGARGDHDLHDHALHGRGRVLRPDRDHGPGPDRRAGHARGAEGAGGCGPDPDRDDRQRRGDRRARRGVRTGGDDQRGRGDLLRRRRARSSSRGCSTSSTSRSPA